MKYKKSWSYLVLKFYHGWRSEVSYFHAFLHHFFLLCCTVLITNALPAFYSFAVPFRYEMIFPSERPIPCPGAELHISNRKEKDLIK